MNIKRAVIVFLLLFVLVILSYFLLRKTILDIALEKVSDKLARYDYALMVGESNFSGIATVYARNVYLIPPSGDTLLGFDKAEASFSLIQFISGHYPVDDLVIDGGFIHVKELPDSTYNFSGLINSKKTSRSSEKKTHRTNNFRKLFKDGWRNFSRLAGLNLSISNFEILWTAPGYSEQLIMQNLSIRNSGFKMDATASNPDSANPINIIGTIDPSKDFLEFHGSSENSRITYLPFIKKISGLNLFSETYGGRIQITEESSEEVMLNIQAAAVRPGINHWRIGPEDVLLDSIGINLNMVIRPESVRIAEPSHFIVNRLPMTVEAGYSKSDSTLIEIRAGFSNVESDAFFNSLPHGLFNSLQGIETKGRLDYKFYMKVNPDNPDSLIFESELKKSNFSIQKFGNENFTLINQEFNYEARENDKVVRNIRVGPENSFYTPLSEVSVVLIGSILVAEDGTFFFHKGFNEEAFRKSMATNIREKRFARGGSTITMQLVKNVFLSRNKTISRKVEEALIVWLIENQRLVSKERMLEVYLNIIEWGPGVYGIGEASEFYFSKKPNQLNLDESIFLSSIIPRPKYFKYSFESDGTLKSYLKNYFDVVAGRLLKKEIISQEEFDKMNYQVELKGRALNIVVPADTISVDSLYIDNAGEIFN